MGNDCDEILLSVANLGRGSIGSSWLFDVVDLCETKNGWFHCGACGCRAVCRETCLLVLI